MQVQNTEREIYINNPLEEVICQLRYPTILKIDTPPIGFQERIRHHYPLFEQTRETTVALPLQLVQQLPQEVRETLFPTGVPAYNFSSADRTWTLTLNRDFLALSCFKYKKWEDFQIQLNLCVEALIEEYNPAFFLRIGLRYQNIIRRKQLGLENIDWSELLNTYVAGEIAAPELRGAIVNTISNVVIDLGSSGGKLRMQHGFITEEPVNAFKETYYLLDNDLFIDQQTEVKNVFEILESFRRDNGRFFRWCITERLKNAMGRQPIWDEGK